jgi:hypothetical protein
MLLSMLKVSVLYLIITDSSVSFIINDL